ncbi:MAG TPA: hypothetical protein VN729_09380, partial [Ktedonobacteraceae bacterium]|nr:hypothetical protein [Ktedonobacteraceae bacterium]
MRKPKQLRGLTLAISMLFTILLSGCNLMPSQQGSATSVTPLALTPTATSLLTPTSDPVSTADWTTYHQNN